MKRKVGEMKKRMGANIPKSRQTKAVMTMAVMLILLLVHVVTTFPQYGHWKLGRGCSPKAGVTTALP